MDSNSLNKSSKITCNKFRPVCLNVSQKSIAQKIKTISKCNESETTNSDLLQYILDEINRKKANEKYNNTSKDNEKYNNPSKDNEKYNNPSENIGNCYSTDNAWLAVIKNIQNQLKEIKIEDIKIEEIAEIQNELKINSNQVLNLEGLFQGILKIANVKWGSSNNKNNNKINNSRIRTKIIKRFKHVVDSEGFKALSKLIDELSQYNTELMNKLKSSNNNKQQITEEQITNYKTIIENLFLYTLPIMNSKTDLSNVFGRDFNKNKNGKNKIDEDFDAIIEMLDLFKNKKGISGGSKYNKKTIKNSGKGKGKGKGKNTYTKKNMKGGVVFFIAGAVVILALFMICLSIYQHFTDAKKLCEKNLNNNKIIDLSSCTKDNILKFVTELKPNLPLNKTLTTLIIKDLNDTNAKVIANVLNDMNVLTKLTISGNDIGNKGVIAIAQALHYNSTLTTLTISGNKIGNDGAIAISELLQNNSTLKTLTISGSGKQINIKGAQAIAQGYNKNTNLTKLVLSFNLFVKETVQSLKTVFSDFTNKQRNDDDTIVFTRQPQSENV